MKMVTDSAWKLAHEYQSPLRSGTAIANLNEPRMNTDEHGLENIEQIKIGK